VHLRLVEKGRPCRSNVWCAVGVNRFVERHHARQNGYEDGTWMGVPSTISTGLKRHLLYNDVCICFRLQVDRPFSVVALPNHVKWIERPSTNQSASIPRALRSTTLAQLGFGSSALSATDEQNFDRNQHWHYKLHRCASLCEMWK